jgi:hypothetical protein
MFPVIDYTIRALRHGMTRVGLGKWYSFEGGATTETSARRIQGRECYMIQTRIASPGFVGCDGGRKR